MLGRVKRFSALGAQQGIALYMASKGGVHSTFYMCKGLLEGKQCLNGQNCTGRCQQSMSNCLSSALIY
eukprot:4769684-Pleurochrysis_carterae.AAC.3